ncbi:hypothetical protein LTR66_012424, partial [Elasticomyces elasticus]
RRRRSAAPARHPAGLRRRWEREEEAECPVLGGRDGRARRSSEDECRAHRSGSRAVDARRGRRAFRRVEFEGGL